MQIHFQRHIVTDLPYVTQHNNSRTHLWSALSRHAVILALAAFQSRLHAGDNLRKQAIFCKQTTTFSQQAKCRAKTHESCT